MHELKRITYVGTEFDYGAPGNVDLEILVEIGNADETSSVKQKIHLNDVSFGDFMTEQDIADFVSGITTQTTPAQFIQLFKNALSKKIAVDLGLTFEGDQVAVPTPTLRTRVDLIQAALDDIILGGAM